MNKDLADYSVNSAIPFSLIKARVRIQCSVTYFCENGPEAAVQFVIGTCHSLIAEFIFIFYSVLMFCERAITAVFRIVWFMDNYIPKGKGSPDNSSTTTTTTTESCEMVQRF